VGVIHPFLQRLAELQIKNKVHGLSDAELQDMNIILDWNVRMCYEAAYLENMSLLASMTSDEDWQHEVCLEIDKLKERLT